MTVTAPPTVLVPGLDGLLRTMADDELVIGWSDSEWTGIAPLLEEDVAMSSLAQDELGHATALYGLLGELVAADPDVLALDRPPEAWRHARLLDHGRGDWAMTIARRYLYETADAIRLEALADGSWAPLAELLAKVRREERYHAMHIGTWFERLARSDGEARTRLVSALRTLAPDAATVFTPLDHEPDLVAAGILDAPMSELERRWRRTVEPTLADLALPPLPAVAAPPDGRSGHGAAFAALWDEMTMVRRSDPGASW